jgi:hypothetical protein
MPELPRPVRLAGPQLGWSKVDPKMREWVDANRQALDLFRRGAEQVDGLAHLAVGETVFTHHRINLTPFVWLALLEGSRLEEQGDIPGAWGWYRSLLDMRAHIMRRGTVFERLFAARNCKGLQQSVSRWAADPKTRAADIRSALNDVIKSEPRPDWDSSSLKVDYLLAMRALERPEHVLNQSPGEDHHYHIAGEPLPPNLTQLVVSTERFLIREPERGRRVLRLVFANWLAHVDVPEERHRKPAVRASFLCDKEKSGVFVYAAGADAPASARKLSPQELAVALAIPQPSRTARTPFAFGRARRRTFSSRARSGTFFRERPRWHVPQKLARRWHCRSGRWDCTDSRRSAGCQPVTPSWNKRRVAGLLSRLFRPRLTILSCGKVS